MDFTEEEANRRQRSNPLLTLLAITVLFLGAFFFLGGSVDFGGDGARINFPQLDRAPQVDSLPGS